MAGRSPLLGRVAESAAALAPGEVQIDADAPHGAARAGYGLRCRTECFRRQAQAPRGQHPRGRRGRRGRRRRVALPQRASWPGAEQHRHDPEKQSEPQCSHRDLLGRVRPRRVGRGRHLRGYGRRMARSVSTVENETRAPNASPPLAAPSAESLALDGLISETDRRPQPEHQQGLLGRSPSSCRVAGRPNDPRTNAAPSCLPHLGHVPPTTALAGGGAGDGRGAGRHRTRAGSRTCPASGKPGAVHASTLHSDATKLPLAGRRILSFTPVEAGTARAP